jgi:hypothetical protein
MYDGKEDLLGWLNRCEHFFRAQHTRDTDKVWLASFHMTRPAQHWYYMLERDAGDIPWHTFKAFCQQRFGPAVGINHLADLARLPFRGSVSDYQDAFLAKMAHTGYLSQEQQVRLFTGGLPDAIRVDVRAASSSSPTTRHGACKGVRTAILILCRYRHCGTAATPVVAFPPSARHICINTVSHPQHAGATSSSQTSPATSIAPNAKPFKKLSPDEMLERRRLGLCYNCNEQYARGHKCPKLFYLEVTDGEDDDSADQDQHVQDECDAPGF